MVKMTSNRPYLLRAMYDWLVDNDCTPHIVVDAGYPGVLVPRQHVSDGQITLNVAPRAITEFAMDLESIAFSTRFGGVPTHIEVPVMAVLGIYARENGQGMVFTVEDYSPDPDDGPSSGPPGKPKSGGKPSLKVVK
jgi:stringent starvation protein B